MPPRNRSKSAHQPALIEALENRWLLTAATLVADLNTGPAYASFSNQISFGGKLYFTSRQDATGQELYSTDGTHTGIVADVNLGPAWSDPRELIVSGGLLYFTANDGTHGRELWRTDGTAGGTSLVYDADPGTVGSDPFALADVNGTLFFEAFTPTGLGLFKTTGTRAGTALVSPLHYADREFAPTTGAAVAGGRYFFQGYDPEHGYELWVSDGSAAGTQLVSDLTVGSGSSKLSELTATGGKVYFVRNGDELWSSDGTAAGTTLVKAFPAAPTGNAVHELVGYGNLLAFRAPDGSTTGVWRTDGTLDGTFVLRDGVSPLIAGPDLLVSDNRLYFILLDQLWQSDGSVAGTSLVYNATAPNPYGYVGQIWNLADGGGTLAFVVHPLLGVIPPPPTHGQAVFGQNQLVTLRAGTLKFLQSTVGTNPSQPALVGNTLYFVSAQGSPILHDELWSVPADGTGQAALVTANQYGTRGSSLTNLGTVDGTFLFGQNVSDAALAPGVYYSDGTSSGTGLLKSISSQLGFEGTPAIAGGNLYFYDNGLWETNGTAAGTVPAQTSGFIPTAFNGRIVVIQNYSISIVGGPSYDISPEIPPIASGGWLYMFGFSTSLQKYGVFRTDGTSNAYSYVATIPLFERSVAPAVSGGKVFFVGISDTGTDVIEDGLYVTDGTATGTSLLHSFAGTSSNPSIAGGLTDVNGALFFWGDDSTNGYAIWKSDGTAAGTVKVLSLPADPPHTQPQQTLAAGGKFFFTMTDPANPSRLTLWASDGTAVGTMPLVEDVPGRQPPAFAFYPNLVNINGIVYFISGQLWRSDGTPAGTYPVLPIGQADPPAKSLIDQSGNELYFGIDDGTHGQELYSLPADYVPPLAQILPPSQGTDNAPVDQITIRFNRAVDNLQVRDLLLAHDGAANVLTGSETLTTSDHVTWTLGNLLPDTFATGTYILSLVPDAGDVTDGQGDPVANYARQTFTVAPVRLVAGEVFNDANHNGVRDPGEAGLAGWTVYLDTNGSPNGDGDPTAVTDADGRYVFTNAPPGTYPVREVVPSGWRRTTPITSAASASVDSDQQAYGPVFGNVQTSTVPMDFSYLLTLAQHYGQAGTFAAGDLTGDDRVDFNDLLLLAQNYGHALPEQAAAAASPTVAAQDAPLARHKLRTRNTLIASIQALH